MGFFLIIYLKKKMNLLILMKTQQKIFKLFVQLHLAFKMSY